MTRLSNREPLSAEGRTITPCLVFALRPLATPSYPVAPGGVTFECRECKRKITAGYPMVPVHRDVVHPEAVVAGYPVSDVLCVYCDE